MSSRPPEVLALWNGSRELVSATQTIHDLEERGAFVGKKLLNLWPAPVFACLLRMGNRQCLAVLDKKGEPRPDWQKLLQDELIRQTENGVPGKSWTADLPPDLGFSKVSLFGELIAYREQHFGVLALALSQNGQREAEAPARELLGDCADRLGPLLFIEQGNAPASAADKTRQARLNEISELTSLVTHEFNNYLNGIVLHGALLEHQLPVTMRSELTVIRRLSNNAAGMVKRLQQYNRPELPTLQPLDLHQVLHDFLEQQRAAGEPLPVQLALAEDLPRVLGHPSYLERLLTLLLLDCAAVVALCQGSITVRTGQAKNKVQVHVEDTGPRIADDVLPHLFEPFVTIRNGSSETSLAVCKLLARRLQGYIQAENRLQGGVAFLIELTQASVPSSTS